MAGKYTPLSNYLKNIPASQKEITLTFGKIEEVLCDKLPISSGRYIAWWNNELEGAHVQAHGWMDACWRVDTVNLTNCWVRFTREKME